MSSGRKQMSKTPNTHKSDLSITATVPLAGILRRPCCCRDSGTDGGERLFSTIVPAMLSAVGCPENADGTRAFIPRGRYPNRGPTAAHSSGDRNIRRRRAYKCHRASRVHL